MKRCPICKTVYSNDANFCPMDAGRLETFVPSAAEGAQTLTPLDLPTMQSQQVGGRFRLGPQLGGRRTGEVYAADDAQTGQSVAVKLIAPAVFPTPLVAQRTERELRQLMKVGSDRIAKIYDVGRMQLGARERMYVAMELVSGTTLAEIISVNGPLPVDVAVRLTMEIGEALAEAAKLGVIHRDVSPKNILLLADDRGIGRRVKLINFGIPTPVTDKVLGIPEFLSPEQAEGKPVDQRSNIYSLGLLLSYVVTGSAPFIGETDAVLRQQTQSPAPAPSQRAQMPILPELDRLVLKALEKSSSRRHLTLRQLLGELEALLPQLHATSPPPARVPAPASAIAAPVPGAPSVPWPAAPPPPVAHVPAQTMLGMSVNAIRSASQGGPGPPGPTSSRQPAVIVPERPLAAAVIVPERPLAAAVVVPDAAPVVIQPQAQPQAPRAPAQQPTMMASPPGSVATAHPAVAAPPRSSQPAPPQVRPTAPGPSAGSGSARGKSSTPARTVRKKGKFRETMWFKKGELDEAVAASAEGDEGKIRVDELPIEDRYKDDGTLTNADAERLTLRTGATTSMPVVRGRGEVPGERMGEDDLVSELRAGRTRLFLILLGVGLVAAMILVYFTVIRH